MPKANSDNLFRLIKSLTRTEKGYFKKFASINSSKGENNYIHLFDAMDKQTEYDEGEIIRKGNFNKINQLPNLKVYLYDLILKSLTSYHSGMDVEDELCNDIHRIKILYNKGLIDQCEKLLLKAKELAVQHEKYELLTELLKWERNIVTRNQRAAGFKKKINALYNERNDTVKKMENISAYFHLADTIYSLGLSEGEIIRNDDELQEYKNIVNHPLLTDENRAITKDAKRFFYYIHAMFYQKTGDMEKSYSMRKKIVDVLESSPEQLKQRPLAYLFNYENLAFSCLQIGKYDEMFAVLKKMRRLPEQLGSKCTESIKAKVFEVSAHRELITYIITCQFAHAVSLMGTIEKGIEEYKGTINKQSKIIFCFNGALIYFIQQDYHKALAWNNKIINDTGVNIREDAYCYARLLNLLIHYELGNEELLESVVKSTYRYLHKKNRLYKTETAILNFIRTKVPAFFTAQERLAAFKELKTELEEITKDPYEKNALKDIDYIAWLESKISGRSFAEVLREKAMKK